MVPKNCLDRGLLLPTNCSHRLRHAAMHYRLQDGWMGQSIPSFAAFYSLTEAG